MTTLELREWLERAVPEARQQTDSWYTRWKYLHAARYKSRMGVSAELITAELKEKGIKVA